MEVGMTKMSTKGQIVIPSDLREEFSVGEKLIVIKSDKRLVIKKASELDENLIEDLEFAKRSDEALERMKKGKGIRMDFDDFLKEMRKW